MSDPKDQSEKAQKGPSLLFLRGILAWPLMTSEVHFQCYRMSKIFVTKIIRKKPE